MLAPLPALVTFPLDSGSCLSVLGTRVRLNASIAPPGSMSSQYADGGGTDGSHLGNRRVANRVASSIYQHLIGRLPKP